VTYLDDIWSGVPSDRPVDRAAYDFAIRAVGGRDRRVLDLGCGDGRLAGELAAGGAEVSGTDPSEVALERARAANPGIGFSRVEPDGRLPFDDGAFDGVACVHVLEHVADTQALMSEARRVLRPGGAIAVTVPFHGRLKSLLIALGSFESHYDPLEPVLRFYTRRSLTHLLDLFGFEDVRSRGAGGPPLLRETLLAGARRAGGAS
jgi:SAM-dependent methyltransferase